jgi:hypothetical protein
MQDKTKEKPKVIKLEVIISKIWTYLMNIIHDFGYPV